MKVVILCGGLGTRLSEETILKPKPMVTIGQHPILWHIMSIYASHGFKDFVLALGYKGEEIKSYFLNYNNLNSNLKVNLASGNTQFLSFPKVDWNVELVDTGQNSMTGGRLHRLEPYLKDQKTFMLTYGDGVANVDISELLKFHRSHGKLATVTSVRPPARFGTMSFDDDFSVLSFREKKQTDSGWINGGFFVFEQDFFKYLDGDHTILEGNPMEGLTRDRQLMGYQHEGFWQCMDTIRDRQYLEDLWANGNADWKCW